MNKQISLFDKSEQFYPTPQAVLQKYLQDVKWKHIKDVLEPSAGRGDIADYIMNESKRNGWSKSEVEVDCIEIDPTLQATLKGKEYRVIHDDFLTFNTFKRYQLIAMNPPFSAGAKHLLKAIEMQKNGGSIFCILNAETLKNPYTNDRKALVRKLEDLGAEIFYETGAFENADRTTAVEIAVIKISIPNEECSSTILNKLKKAEIYEDDVVRECTELADADLVENAVLAYNRTVAAGIKLIQEYYALTPFLHDDYNYIDILTLKIGSHSANINTYVKFVRMMFWSRLFKDKRFTAKMTSQQQETYLSKVNELKDYDFSVYNIKQIQIELCNNMIKGIEDCIMRLFEDFTHTYSWLPETTHNIHYYNGWRTNDSFMIGKKVILPMYGLWNSYRGCFEYKYTISQKLNDIEKVLDYLSGQPGNYPLLENTLRKAETEQQSKKIRLKYFTVDFYKKETCHIKWNEDTKDLVKKLNIFAGRKYGWLPNSYGRKRYEDMSSEEQNVIDSFEGKASYEDTLNRANYFIYSAKDSVPMLTTLETGVV